MRAIASTRRRLLLGAVAVAAVIGVRPAQAMSDAALAQSIEDLLAQMTLEEKLGQLNQAPPPGTPIQQIAAEDGVRNGRIGSFQGVHGVSETRTLQRVAVEQTRLRIPLLFAHDVIHGYRTIFPVPLAEAASFDPEAVEGAARIAAVEAAANGVHWTFAPMLDIARDPRWGRIVEGSGEDPYLGAVMGAARVRGFQGDDLSDVDTVAATAKHFVAYGAGEGGRDYNVADISERSLREVYLPPFHKAVAANVATVMASFNEVAGEPMHANRQLIGDLLRGDWGFKGLVVSDYTGVRELMMHGVAATDAEAGALALRAGVDIDMVGETYMNHLSDAVTQGRVGVEEIDAAVRRVLRLKHDLGLFEDPYRYCDEGRARARTLNDHNRDAARDVARKSFVLLKNEGGVLPFSKRIAKLAVIGPLADDGLSMLGSWRCAGEERDAVSPLAGMRAALGEARVRHALGAAVLGDDASNIEDAARLAGECDAVLLCLGESADMTGEARSRTSLDLPGVQEALALRVLALGKPTAVLLFSGRPLSIPGLAQAAPAILQAWLPGVEAGNALADVVFGDVSPAGRLPVTFPRNVGQVPIYYAHRNTGRPGDVNNPYSSKYIDAPWAPLYPFGHGLSYAQFEYERLTLSSERIGANDGLRVNFEVVNRTNVESDEVIQLYVRDDVASITRPVMELKRFARLRFDGRERRRLSFDLGPADFAMLSADLRPVVEPGRFTVFVGGSSVQTISASFEVA